MQSISTPMPIADAREGGLLKKLFSWPKEMSKLVRMQYSTNFSVPKCKY